MPGVIWVLTAVALAGDWYVDAAAGAGGDGSVGAPFATLQQGLDVALPGDTVHVAAGTYDPITTVRDGEAAARIRVVSEPSRAAVVQAAGRALDGAHPYHTFEGLVFDGGYGGSQDVLRMGGSDHLELIDVEVRRAYGGDCVDLRDASDVRIVDSEIHHCVAGQPGSQVDSHGVTGDSVFDLTISDSQIYLVSGDAVQLSPSRVPWDRLVIERCALWSGALDEDASLMPAGEWIGENALDTKVGSGLPRVEVRDVTAWGWRGVIENQAAFNVKEAVDTLIERVTVYDAELAFRLRHPATVEVRNAVVWDVDVAFRLEDGLVDARLAALTVGEDVGEVFRDAGGEPVSLTVQNLLHVGPLGETWPLSGLALQVDGTAFRDSGAGDYHLADGSPAIDLGEALAGFSDDRDGGERPQGAGWDLGAYEWGTEAPTTTTPTGSTTGATTGAATGGTGATDPGHGTDPAVTDPGGCGCTTGRAPGGLAWIWIGLLGGLRRLATTDGQRAQRE